MTFVFANFFQWRNVYFPPDVFVIYFLNFQKKKKIPPGVSREVGRSSSGKQRRRAVLTSTCTKLILMIRIRPSLLLPLCTTYMYILHNQVTGSGSVTSVYRVSYHSSKLYNLECFEFIFVLECCLFLGRLNCRFRAGDFVVKPRWKTSYYLTRNYLDSNTPLFYT